MYESVIAALFFFLPAGVANMIPIPASKAPYLKNLSYPIDFNKTWRGKRILGDHKTIRGFVVGFLGALLNLIILRYIYIESSWIRNDIAYVDYEQINIYMWALVFTIGVLGGDALKSFFKRQLNKPPGTSWFPFDQLDYVIGGILASTTLVILPLADYLVIAIVWFIVHPIATYTGWLLKLKKDPI